MRGRTINTQESLKINSANSIKGAQDLTSKDEGWIESQHSFSVGPFQKFSIYIDMRTYKSL